MAKMKVHELAKELDIQSKDIVAFLQEKGIAVKAAQSSIEDDAIELVKGKFAAAKAAVKKEVQKSEPAAEPAKKEAAPEAKKEQPVKNKPSEAAPVKNNAPKQGKGAEEPVKKKKKIIFVSNPGNSGNKGAAPAQGGARNNFQNQPNRGQNQSRAQAAYRPIKPLTPPSPTPAVTTIESKPQVNNNKPAKEAPVVTEAVNNTVNNTVNTAKEERTNDGFKRNDGENRQNSNNNQANRKSFDNNQSGSRNQANNGRDNRPGTRSDARSKKGSTIQIFESSGPSTGGENKRRNGKDRERSKKDMLYEEQEIKNQNKAGRFIKPEKKVEEPEEQIKVITLPEKLTIKELADKMKMQPSVIIKKLFMLGQIVTVNTEISYEEAENIAIDYEIICEQEVKVDVIEELLKEEEDSPESLVSRPPVICVMGHVDHGKTSLLDAIRKTNVTDKEAGGITQAIGAYTVDVNGQKITFLDTPGHEAFTAMRMRGANATDIAILVVAADDGVMPQTVEAINHAKAAGIEIIVAVNKVDKPNANIDRVKQEMTEYELIPVDWGGSTEFVPVSAKTGAGIEDLLETILLTAEILELKANPKRNARGLVIEAELDKGRGPVATVLVQKGTLHVGDFISAGASHGKVRAMLDDKGRRIKDATPSTPVEILGLSDVPSAGEVFIVHENDKTAKSYAETYQAQHKQKMLEDTKTRMSLDELFTQIQAGNVKELNIIVKADVQGSVEAVKQSLVKLSNEEVVVKCIHGGVGAINESDVILASASSAIIIGFNVRPDAQAKSLAEREGVDLRLYRVIYQAIEDVEAAMKGMLDPVYEEKVIGHAEVRQIFKASAVGNIAGSYVLDGEFKRDCKVRISREGEQIYEGQLNSLKRFKDDVKEVKAGFECGLVFDGFDQMQELDIVEAYIMVEVPR